MRLRSTASPDSAPRRHIGRGYDHSARVSTRTAGCFWFDAPIVGLLSSGIVALIVASDKSTALRAFGWLATGIAMYFLASRLGQSRALRRLVAHALMLWGAALAAYVILQYEHLDYEIKLEYLDRVGRALSAFVPRLWDWTPFSNTVATILEGILPVALAFALSRESRGGWRIVEMASALVMVLALALVASRGAWLGLTVACLMWVLAWVVSVPRPALRWRLFLAAGTVMALMMAAVAINGDALARAVSATFDRPDRLDVYRNSLVLIGDFPFTGIGIGDQFAGALARYALLIQVPFLTYSHNLYLDVWLELGLIGILSFVFLVGSICGAVISGERAQASMLFRGIWVGLLATLVHGLVDARQSVDGWTWLPFFVLVGLLAGRGRQSILHRGFQALSPAVAAAAFLVVALPYLWPFDATWQANVGSLVQARADFGQLSEAERARFMTNAREYYADALRLDSGQPTALRRLGILAIDDRRFDDARALLEAAWVNDAGNPATRKALGLASAWTGDLDRARRLLTTVPSIVEELNVWSWWWENQGQAAQAVYAARLSLLMQPEQPDVLRRLMELEDNRRRLPL